jgi:hypothetical protein
LNTHVCHGVNDATRRSKSKHGARRRRPATPANGAVRYRRSGDRPYRGPPGAATPNALPPTPPSCRVPIPTAAGEPRRDPSARPPRCPPPRPSPRTARARAAKPTTGTSPSP